jgi:phosphate transport system substrate-binding protein
LPIARGFADYFQEAVFLGSRKWNPSMREFADEPGSRGGATDGGHKMLEALADDRYGIGYAGLVYRHPDVRPVALASRAGEPYIAPTRESVTDRSYPLTRVITMYLDRAPGQPVEPKLREFLRYVLSREGQQIVLREGQGYLPVIAPIAQKELEKLD